MITFLDGSIFDSDAKYLVNPVNCIGISGKGLAKEFKIRYPENYNYYKHYCETGKLKPGYFVQYRNILNLATKDHWKNHPQKKLSNSVLLIL